MPYLDKPPIIDTYFELVEKPEKDDIKHYGIKRRSGRYPWGSGEDPYQHSGDLYSRVKTMRKEGMKDSEIAKALGIGETDKNGAFHPSVNRLKAQYSLARNEHTALLAAKARDLREKGYTLDQIAEKMGYKNDSSVRSLFKQGADIRVQQAKATADLIEKNIKEKGMIEVGKGVERQLNISREMMNQALEILREKGYPVYGGRMPQINNPGKQTTMTVICPPGTPHKAIFDYGKINFINDTVSKDGGETFQPRFTYPSSLDSKRLMIRYKEDGGIDKDGIVELRRNVPDLSLGESRYAQVRILVDGKKYIKGMAVYSDDMPDGVDVIFNTNKSKDIPKLDVLKDIKEGDNPFGSSIKDAASGGQYYYTDKNGKKKLGLINKTREEGDWEDWSDHLPSQFLSKQSTALAKRQLSLAVKDKKEEFDEINSLTNPTVKKKLLEDFANSCDYDSVHLHAAALPRQKYQVIIPITSMKDNEVYAPRYKDGEKVALIRYPHGGTFEIPILTVNNKQKDGKKILGTDISDAIGINSNVASRLSGADFDGDTVMVIPTNSKVKINSSDPLPGLVGFDPKMSYGMRKEKNPKYHGQKGVDEYIYYNKYGKPTKVMNNTQNEMGRISNLITDMTLQGADTSELARAVRHSMVVIDAEKHKLDYRSSYIDNDIATLKKKYQKGGASTIISRAKSEESVLKRQGSPRINIKGSKYYDPSKPEGSLLYKISDDLYYVDRTKDKSTNLVTLRTTTGKKIVYDPSDEVQRNKYTPIKKVDPKTDRVYYTNKDGTIEYKVKIRKQKSTLMAETDDARTLMSNMRTPMEQLYADYANQMKYFANEARKDMVATKSIKYDRKAAQLYNDEVKSLKYQLNEARKNSPKEKQAQAIANSRVKAFTEDNPDMTKEEIKKRGQQELNRARDIVGAKRVEIKLTDREWEAIQAGAITETTLKDILKNTNLQSLREKAMPKQTKTLSSAQQGRIRSLQASGLTLEQIANVLGVSTSTVSKYLKGKEH